jgi:ABC-type polysaccharide/polyol phosphate export permease
VSTISKMNNLSQHWWILWALAVRSLRERYAGTLGGLLWAIVHPLAMMALFWVVFDLGFRAQPASGVPFILLLFTGLVPWFMFADAASGGVSAITSHGYLIKKVAFPSELLALAPVVAAAIPHFVLLVALGIYCGIEGLLPGWGVLLAAPVVVGLFMFVSGLSLLLSAINVLNRETAQVFAIVLNLWFWATPIVWSLGMLPPKLAAWFALNPMIWVVDGYRAAFLGATQAPLSFGSTIYFWIVCVGLVIVGHLVFKRLQPFFADTL